MTNNKEFDQLKRQYGNLKKAHNNLKIKSNLKSKEIKYLRNHLRMIVEKCEKVLGRGKHYLKEENLGRKYGEYKGTNKRRK